MTQPPVPRRAVRADGYPALEEALALEVRRAHEADPLRPIDLLVGSNLLGTHLRRSLARRHGAVAGVRTLTFLDLARVRGESVLAASGLRPVPPLGDELVIGRVVASLPVGGYFEPVRETPGFRTALLASIRDLKDAGWTPVDLRARLGSARPDVDVRRKLDAFVAVFDAYERALRERRLYDRSDLLARAAAPAGAAGPPPPDASGDGLFLVYGFYDLIELQWRLLEAHAGDRETVVFVPAGEGPALAFAEPLVRRLQGAGFRFGEIASEGSAPHSPGIARLLSRLFPAPGAVGPAFAEDTTPRRVSRAVDGLAAAHGAVQIGLPFDEDDSTGRAPRDGPSNATDESVAFLSAPSEEREAEEIVGQLLAWAVEGIRFHEMAVLARRREPHLTTIARALRRAEIPFVAATGEPLADSPAASALTALLAIAREDWKRGDVIAFLSLADLPPAQRALPDGSIAAVSEWDLLTAEGGIVGGRDDWTRAFAREIGRARARTSRLDEARARRVGLPADEDDDVLEAKLADARRSVDLWRRLEETVVRIDRALGPWERASSWAEAAQALGKTLRALIAPSPERDAIGAMLDELARLDAAGPYAGREELVRMVRRALVSRRARRGRYERDGVLLADVVTARGLTFRAVAVAGLVERGFPVQGREDPILLDAERSLLGAEATALARLPLKGARTSEEKLLFRIAAGAASERLLLSRARAMGIEERESLPSPFYRESLDAVSGETPRERHVDLLPPVHTHGATALDAHAWALGEAWSLGRPARTAGALRPGTAGAAASLREVYPFLDLSLEAEASRWRTRAFGPHDGMLGPAAAALAAGRLLADPLSASRIERYAECPLRALFGGVLGLRHVPDPGEVTTIDALDRGLLYHEILADLFASLAAESGGRARLAELDRETLDARLVETAERHFAKLAADSPVGYPLLWEVEKTRMRDNLSQCLEETIEESAASGYLPAAFEWTFGRGEASASAVAMDLGPGGRVSFQGRIDRIDVHRDGRRARVVDYKTRDGAYVGGEKRLADGRSIQLPIYMEAAEAFRPAPGERLEVDAGGYVFVSGDKARWIGGETAEPRRATLRAALEVLIGSIRAGDFTADPRPGGACGICDFRDPCGESRLRLFARKRGDAAVAVRLALRERS